MPGIVLLSALAPPRVQDWYGSLQLHGLEKFPDAQGQSFLLGPKMVCTERQAFEQMWEDAGCSSRALEIKD